LALSAAVITLLALPVLPAEDTEPVAALHEDVGETIGWPDLTEGLTEVFARRAAPPTSRS
jgi:hypothetical protein